MTEASKYALLAHKYAHTHTHTAPHVFKWDKKPADRRNKNKANQGKYDHHATNNIKSCKMWEPQKYYQK